jgi:hypothetical protein
VLYQTCWLNALSQYGARDAPARPSILLDMNAERERVEDGRPPPTLVRTVATQAAAAAAAAAAAIARRYRDTTHPYINAERVAAPRRAEERNFGLGRFLGQTPL